MPWNNAIGYISKDSFSDRKKASAGGMHSSKILLKPQIYIICSWQMPSEFVFSFDCSFTIPTKSIRGTLPVLGAKQEKINDLQGSYINVLNRPTQLVSRFELLRAIIRPHSQHRDVSKIILDIKCIVVLMNLLEVVVDVVRSVTRDVIKFNKLLKL